ncbi:hypothetical protein MMC13_007024 [Lambiella insularis]|nr:hypothetical protein [Lambiella insularis]
MCAEEFHCYAQRAPTFAHLLDAAPCHAAIARIPAFALELDHLAFPSQLAVVLPPAVAEVKLPAVFYPSGRQGCDIYIQVNDRTEDADVARMTPDQERFYVWPQAKRYAVGLYEECVLTGRDGWASGELEMPPTRGPGFRLEVELQWEFFNLSHIDHRFGWHRWNLYKAPVPGDEG